MARKPNRAELGVSNQPIWPTTVRTRLRDGRLQGVDGSIWLYRAVPLAPVADARSTADLNDAARPIMDAFHEMELLARVPVKRRRIASGSYRDFHMLLVNVPQLYSPDRNHPLSAYLRANYGHETVNRRVALFGVRLLDKVGGGGGIKQTVESVAEVLVSGQVPLADFDEDYQRVSNAMDRAGLIEPSPADMKLADSWWNMGRGADTPTVRHADHLHFFTSTDGLRQAHQRGLQACEEWDDPPIPGQHAVTFCSVNDLDLPLFDGGEIDSTEPAAWWACDMLSAGALALSVRGKVEPAVVTRDELRRQRKSYIDDINERYQQGKMSRTEQEDMLGSLKATENIYARGHGTATLASASILVAFNGQVHDIDQKAPGSVAKLQVMSFRQPGAHTEMMLCSPYRANPNLLDLPSQAVAYSGVPSLANVGDLDGALLGFTESDRQPAFVSPTAASAGDALPLSIVAGATGAGKSQMMLMLADQYARLGVPTIVLDPKMGSDHSPIIQAAGGQVASLDSLQNSDGIFDPIRFSASAEVGADLATNMILQINPWGPRRAEFEVPMQKAIFHGISRGATCIGEALTIANADLKLDPEMVNRVFDLAESSPLARACIGINPGTQALSVHRGLTLIKVGDANLVIEGLDTLATHEMSPTQRITLALIRMMVFGTAMALAGQGGGVLMLDEAWTFLGAGRAEVERLGRLARSQNVLPMLYTQRVTDALNAGLAGYISRGFVLPIEDPSEAAAACELFKLEPTPERMGRITARATKGALGGSTAPNWNSMRALRDTQGNVVRGAVAIYSDLAGRAVPVEIRLSTDFLRLSSTRPEDIRARDAALRAQAQAS